MISSATSVQEYLDSLPPERKAAIQQLRNVILENLPEGFTETMSYGMIGYVVPHSLYPQGYHCSPELPLPFMSIASQKNFVAVYHMGMYADPKLLQWFTDAYAAAVPGKIDMGKSCIRFKKIEQIPNKLIGELAGKMKVEDWIELYEKSFRSK